MSHHNITMKIIVLTMFLLGLNSCGPTPVPGSETWALVKLISKGVPVDNVVTEIVETRNCIVPETKTTNCSAGTTNNLSVQLGGGIQVGAGLSGSIDSSITAQLGIGLQGGTTMDLDTPPAGFIYSYGIEKRFSVITGQVLARSQNGNEQTSTYTYDASCSITITSRDLKSCSTTGSVTGGNTGLPPIQTNSISFTVYANRPWQDTGVLVNPGDTLVIRYISGTWRWTADRPDYDGNGDPTANGSYLDICPNNATCPVMDASLEALVGKIGLSGTPFLIGYNITYIVPSDVGNNQIVFLMGNDNL